RRRDARDDNLLLAVTAAYQRASMEVCAATDFAPELLVKHGILVGKSPGGKLRRDIEAGWHVAKQMGGMDIGQTITIKDGTVIAVEAIEGTDACIERTGQLCPRGGWTLVKVSKPNQDMRFDVPTIGPQTVQRVHRAGGKAIAIEADKTILVDQQQTLEAARAAGIRIVAIDPAELASSATSLPPRQAA
ncbi:MAG: UDP-2,3-diacylglucosamine diphosphatase LpxI, partial [Pirellulales bacterium]|nr:UDP-2,3-diacylglucosamine diphosphatase LpxI [Pirellulales bacterium]